MGRKVIDISGERFGKLVVSSFVNMVNSNSRWLCVCDCGNNTIVSKPALTSGETISCGCYGKIVRSRNTHK